MKLTLGNLGNRQTGLFEITGTPEEFGSIQLVGKKMEKLGYIEVVVEGCDKYESMLECGWDKGAYTEKELRKFYSDIKKELKVK